MSVLPRPAGPRRRGERRLGGRAPRRPRPRGPRRRPRRRLPRRPGGGRRRAGRPSTSPATPSAAAPCCPVSRRRARPGCRRTSGTGCSRCARCGTPWPTPRRGDQRAATATSCCGRSTPATSTPGVGRRPGRDLRRGQPRAAEPLGRPVAARDGLHGPRRRRPARRRLAGQPDPDVAGLAVGGARRAPPGATARTRCSATCSTARAPPTGWAGSGPSAPAAASPTASAAGRSRSGRPQLCRSCPLAAALPDRGLARRRRRPGGRRRARPRPGHRCPAGPTRCEGAGEGEVVWLTAESLGAGDPALAADPDRPGGVRLRRAAAAPAAALGQAAGLPGRDPGRARRRPRRSRCAAARVADELAGLRAGRHPRPGARLRRRAAPRSTSARCTPGRGWCGPGRPRCAPSAPGARASVPELTGLRDGRPAGPAVPGWTPRPAGARRSRCAGHHVAPRAARPSSTPPTCSRRWAAPPTPTCGPTAPTEQPRDLAATTALVGAVLADPGAETFVAVPHGGAAGRRWRPTCASSRRTARSRSAASCGRAACRARPRPPRRSTCCWPTPSTTSATAGSSGSATRSTSRRAGRRPGSASSTRAASATTWSSRATTATPTGSRSPTPSGPRCARRTGAGSTPPTSTQHGRQLAPGARRLGTPAHRARVVHVVLPVGRHPAGRAGHGLVGGWWSARPATGRRALLAAKSQNQSSPGSKLVITGCPLCA